MKMIFRKTILYIGAVSILRVEAIEPNWEDIMSKTKSRAVSLEENMYSEEADKIFSWERCLIDWDKVRESANNGSSVSQYALAEHLFKLSGELFNGERIKMRTRAYMYAIISAVIGNFKVARSEYIEPDNNLSESSKLADFLEVAKHMAEREEF